MEHHILTTGISLVTNFIKAQQSPLSQSEALLRHLEVQKHFLADPVAASAEINSLNSRTKFLEERQPALGATLIYTKTAEGKMVTSLLENFLKKQGIAPLHKIQVKSLDKPAKDSTPEWAQQNVTEALTQLRQSVSSHITKLREKAPDLQIQLNCTSGYKAEVAVLYSLGIELDVPVYYLHESFKVCVTLP
jgi:putative CRISPR-associated protein (TIGR02619 family)